MASLLFCVIAFNFAKMIFSHALLAIGWIVYCSLHSILAATSFKKYPHKWMGMHSKFYRLYYSLFSFAGLVVLLYLQFTVTSMPIFVETKTTEILGLIVSAIGALIMVVCISKYFFQLSGLKSLIRESAPNELMITGIHKYVRHPLYTGTFIFIWGLLIVYPMLSLLITNIIITIYTLIGIRFEEKKLVKEFGDSYKSYKENTPMLIPGAKREKE
jgi:protein-S-isoprenylcysteine O-methyltransferase Ste14